jgi:hypothetical protein
MQYRSHRWPQLHASSVWDKIRTEVERWKHGARMNCQKDREHNEHDTDIPGLWDKISDSHSGVTRATVCLTWHTVQPTRRIPPVLLYLGSKFDIEVGESMFVRNDCVSWKHTWYQSPENTTILGWRNRFLVGQGLLIFEASWSHSQSVGMLWTSDQPQAETTQHS